jgi:thiol-disulfide isomerase/thioredoxin
MEDSEEFTEQKMQTILNNFSEQTTKQLLLIKFTASWCAPCNAIKPTCEEYIQKFPSQILYHEIDIDSSLDLYVKLKKYKMLNGIPALLAYHSVQRDKWYVPDDSHLGGNKVELVKFFDRCINYVS